MNARFGRLAAGAAFAAAVLLAVAQPVRGQEAPSAEAAGGASLLHRPFLRGWRLALGRMQEQAASVFTNEFNLVQDQVAPNAMGFAFDRFWVLDMMCGSGWCGPGQAFAYTPAGQLDPDRGFALAPRVSWEGMTAANGLLYLVGVSEADDVFAYTPEGERVPSAEFRLAADDNYNPRGIVHVDGRFYVLDSGQEGRRRAKVYAYTTAGVRVPAADFDLGLKDADFARDMAYVDGLFHINVQLAGWDDLDKVKIYRPNGERVGSSPFRRTFVEGMALANGRFYVLGHGFRVCAYTLAGERVLIDPSVSEQPWCRRD